MEKTPLRIGDRVAWHGLETDAGIPDVAPFLFDLFTLSVIECGEECVEVSVSLILPMKLHAVTQHQSAVRHLRRFVHKRKQAVQR